MIGDQNTFSQKGFVGKIELRTSERFELFWRGNRMRPKVGTVALDDHLRHVFTVVYELLCSCGPVVLQFRRVSVFATLSAINQEPRTSDTTQGGQIIPCGFNASLFLSLSQVCSLRSRRLLSRPQGLWLITFSFPFVVSASSSSQSSTLDPPSQPSCRLSCSSLSHDRHM